MDKAKLTGLLLCVGVLSGCVFFKAPTAPMQKLDVPSAGGAARHLILLLPGMGDAPQDLVRHGLLESLQRAPQFDAIVPDAHFGYYKGFTVLERLHDDIVAPVRDRYDEFWVLGISMGGYGAASYAERYREEVTGLILLAPYLGQRKIIQSIKKDGGLMTWKPSEFAPSSDRSRHDLELWTWFQQRPRHRDAPHFIAGIGADDSLMPSFSTLRPAVESERIYVIPGHHDWDTWVPIFEQIVENELIAR